MLDNIRIKAQKRLSEISTSVAGSNFMNPFSSFVPSEDIPPAHTIKVFMSDQIGSNRKSDCSLV